LNVFSDPEKMPFEVLKQPIHFMKDPENEAPGWLKEANEAIKQADGFIIVSSEYNCGIPPALSNMMDYFPPSSYRHRPCGLVTYSLGKSLLLSTDMLLFSA
jgi:NAD(P)H-dependent FMN reductase